MPTTYQELRSRYDLAFRELARESQRVTELQRLADADRPQLATAEEQLAAAQLCYLQARNALASYLLSRKSECRLAAYAHQSFRAIDEHVSPAREAACASC